MRYANSEGSRVAIETTNTQLRRWLFGVERLGVAVDYISAVTTTAVSPQRVSVLRKLMESTLASVVVDEAAPDKPVAVTLEVGSDQRRVFSALGNVAAAELRDPEKGKAHPDLGEASVHTGLMHGMFGGQATFPIYTEQAAVTWLNEAQAIAYDEPAPFIASPV